MLGHRVAYFAPESFFLVGGESFPQASFGCSVSTRQPGMSALPTEQLESCWVDGRAGVGKGPGLPSFMPFSKDKPKGGGQKDSTKEGTVACSVVARAFN